MPYGVKANVRAPHRFLRYGGLCWVSLTNHGVGGAKIEVIGMSRGGRKVNTWVDARDLTNYRAGWIREFDPYDYAGRDSYPAVPIPWDSRKQAQRWADGMNETFGSQPVRPHAAAFGHA